MSVWNTYGPVDRAIISRGGQFGRVEKSTVRRDTKKAPEYKPFSRDEYSLGRYQRASSARLARRIKAGVLVVGALVAAALVGAALAALSSGMLG